MIVIASLHAILYFGDEDGSVLTVEVEASSRLLSSTTLLCKALHTAIPSSVGNFKTDRKP
jgi:hypothetical protein